MAKRSAPEVNAGSMADIAFLLLIFFLVTTTIEKDSGMLRNMPVDPPENLVPPKIKQKNIFQVTINKNNGLFVITGGEEKKRKRAEQKKTKIETNDQ
jgi:biopolymer transport protein ExbD